MQRRKKQTSSMSHWEGGWHGGMSNSREDSWDNSGEKGLLGKILSVVSQFEFRLYGKQKIRFRAARSVFGQLIEREN